jgi:hypothetical protein
MNRTQVTAISMALTLSLGTMTGCASRDERPAHYADATGGEQFADVVVVRPMTLIASGVGLVAWVASLPFSLPAGNADQLGQEIVLGPLNYTFNRPVGAMGLEDVHEKPMWARVNEKPEG